MPGDVDTATAAPTNGQVLVWNNGASKFEFRDKSLVSQNLQTWTISTFTSKGGYQP